MQRWLKPSAHRSTGRISSTAASRIAWKRFPIYFVYCWSTTAHKCYKWNLKSCSIPKKNFLLVLVPIHVLTISIPLFSGQNLNFHRPHTKKIVCRVFQQTGAGHWDPSPASRAAFSMSALANVSSDSLILASMLTWRWSSDGEEKTSIYIYIYLLFIYLFI